MGKEKDQDIVKGFFMLIIYSAFYLGGIETFFLNLAKQRHKKKLKTKFLLFNPEKSDGGLYCEIEKYADIYTIDDLQQGFSKIFFNKTPLLAPLVKDRVKGLINNVDTIHVTNGMNAIFALKLLHILNEKKFNIKLTVGFYHSLEFFGGLRVPYYEKVNRNLILKEFPKENLFLFSEDVLDLYKNKFNTDLKGAQTFNLGVVFGENRSCKRYYSANKTIKIVSIGRLVDFKTYNSFMLDVVSYLRTIGFEVYYDVYGDGPMLNAIEEKICYLGLSDFVTLKGQLPYSDFDDTVKQYDLFIGSGTSIVQASANGVVSIIGVESLDKPKTYGFFSNFAGSSYNSKYLHHPLIDISKLIVEFTNLKIDEKNNLAIKHFNAGKFYYVEECEKNFRKAGVPVKPQIKFSLIAYEISRKIDSIKYRFFKSKSFIFNKYNKLN